MVGVNGDNMPQIFFKKVMVVRERADFEVSYFHFPRHTVAYAPWYYRITYKNIYQGFTDLTVFK